MTYEDMVALPGEHLWHAVSSRPYCRAAGDSFKIRLVAVSLFACYNFDVKG